MSGEGGARVPPARERDRASARERRGSRFPRHGAPVARSIGASRWVWRRGRGRPAIRRRPRAGGRDHQRAPPSVLSKNQDACLATTCATAPCGARDRGPWESVLERSGGEQGAGW
ncbi:unnamed protein product [Prorocentrum cordatum]|uniref:Uncharacterized protein n=1 Tax=Prorocentrum cordatum TaxID=2364126 RepID=A0ABN9WK75_9DINO|nr:unnamed protein product [Polarella glacialis]